MRHRRSQRVSRYARTVSARRRGRWLRRLRMVGIVLSALLIVAANALPALFPGLLARGEALPGGDPGLAVWSRSGQNRPFAAPWDGFEFGVAVTTQDLGQERILRMAVSETRDEAIVVGVKDDRKLRGEMWSSGSWAKLPNNDLATVSASFWWGFDVAYESTSGDAVLVWNNGSKAAAGLSYQVWDGSAWSAEKDITTPVSGEPQQMQLAADPTSDEMVLVVSNDASKDYALVWNGSSWGNAVTLSSSGTGDDRTDVAVAYEHSSGTAVVVYGHNSSSVFYRTWNGSTWSSEQAVAVPAGATGTVRWTTLAGDPSSDRIALGVLTNAYDIWLAVWDGSTWGDRVVATTSTPSLVAPAVAVAFEAATGEALAVYAESSPIVRYRTWEGSGWSAELDGPDLGDVPNSMLLRGRNGSPEIMLLAQDSASDLSAVRWDGTSWRPPEQLEGDTNEVKNMPFAFGWLGVPPNGPPVFDSPLVDRTDTEGVTVTLATTATDPDGDPIRYSASGLPPGLSIDQASGQISGSIAFPTSLASPYAVTVRAEDGKGGLAVDTFTWTVSASDIVVLTTDNNVASSGAPGLTSWVKGAVLTLGDPGLAFDPPTTEGTFRLLQDLTPMGVGDPQGIHVVTAATTVGSGSSVALLPGDLLFVDKSGGTLTSLNSISVSSADLVRFRPVSPGDYSAGTFAIVLESPLGAEIRSVALVESAVTVAPGVTLEPGSFLLSRAGGAEHSDVYLYVASSAGAGSTSGTVTKLVEGTDLGVSDQIWGIDLLEHAGYGLPGGALLLTYDKDVTLSGLALPRHDVASLVLTGTSLGGGTASGNATRFIDGSDIGIDSDAERFNGFDLISPNHPPVVSDPGPQASTEGAAESLVVVGSDPDGDQLTWTATGLPVGLSIDPDSAEIFGTVSYVADAGSPYAVTVRATDPGGLFDEVTFAWSISDAGTGFAVTKSSDAGGSVGAGDRIHYTITATNYDVITHTGVAVADPLPTGVSYVPGSSVVTTPGGFGGTYRDDFAGVSYSGSTGSLDWSGTPWGELGEADGPSVGNVRATSGSLSIYDGGFGAVRMADLSSFVGASLTYRVSVNALGASTLDIDVSDNGSSWVTVQSLTAADGVGTWTLPVDAYAGGSLYLRFSATAASPMYQVNIDYVEIADGSGGPGSGPGGAPPALATGFTLQPGQTLTVEFEVDVDDPPGVSSIDNEASVTSDQQPIPTVGSVVDAVSNRPPVVAAVADQADAEGDAVSLAMSGSDPDGEALTWSAAGLPGGLAIDPGSGLISGTVPHNDAAGSPYSVTVRATDPGGLFDEVTFAWSITDVSTGFDVTKTSDAGGSVVPGDRIHYTITVTNADVIGHTGIIVSDPLPAGVTFVPGSTVVVAPSGSGPGGTPPTVASGYGLLPGESLTVEFEVDVDDPPGVSSIDNEASVTSDQQPIPTVGSVVDAVSNRPPVVAAVADQADAEGDAVSLAMSGSDPDGEALTWSAAGLPGGLAIDPGTGLVSGTLPYAASTGSPYSVTVRATDPRGLFDEAAFAWTITDTNLAPTFDQDLGDRSGAEGDAVSIPIPATDVDGDTLTYSATGLPPGLSVDFENGIVIGSIAFAAVAGSPYAVTLRVEDPGGLFDEDTFVWTVTDTPTMIDIAKTSDVVGRAQPGSTVGYSIVVTNPEGTPATSVSVSDGLPAGSAFVPGSATYSLVDAARDSFESGGYSGSDGTIPWSGPWIEIDGSGPDSQLDGVVASSRCAGGSCLFVKPAFESGIEGVTRSVDLSGAPSATFSYRVARTSGGGQVRVRVSGNGQPWTTLATYTLNINDPVPLAASFDIGAFAAADTAIRVEAAVAGSGRLYVDDVAVSTGILTAAAGAPPALVSGVTLAPGESLTVEFSVAVDDPPAAGTLVNTAMVTTAEDPAGVADTVVDAVNRYPIFDQDLPDRADPEGTAVSLPAPASDPDGDGMTWGAAGLPPGLSIDPGTGVISGTIAYTAAAGSPYAVTVTVDDADGLTDTDVFTWTVSDVNRGPVVDNPGDQGSAEGDAVSLVVTALDPEGDGISWGATGLPPGLSIDPVSGAITGTIGFAASSGSPYSVTVTATDDGTPPASGGAVFAWTVADTNRAPSVTNPGPQADAEGDPVSVPMAGSDPDGDGLTWSATGLPAGLMIDPGTGEIAGTVGFTAAAGSPHSVTVRATDDGLPAMFAEVSFTWTVADTNRPPSVTHPGDQGSGEGDVVSLVIAGSDPDGDGVTWSATGLPPGLSIASGSGNISGTVSYTASTGSPFAVTVRATDDSAPSAWTEISFSWTIADTNRSPIVTDPGDRSNAEDDTVSFVIAGSDPDGDGLTWSAANLPPGLGIDPASGMISGTIDFVAGAGSPYSAQVEATDDGSPNLTTTVTFTWTVAETNRPPTVGTKGPQQNAEGDAVTVAMTGADPDGDGLTWSATSLPAGLTIDPATGVISGMIDFSAAAGSPYTTQVTLTDDGSPVASAAATFGWVVTNTNRVPLVTGPGPQSGDEGDAVSLAIAGSDPDGDGVTWSATGLPPGLTIDSGTGTISGSIAFTGADGSPYAVVVTATDDGSPRRSTPVYFSWTVGETNRAPVLGSLSDRSDREGDQIVVTLIASDPDGGSLNWDVTGLPPGLEVSQVTGRISGTLTFDAAGLYPVSVTVTDTGTPRLSDTGSFTWSVAETNRAPVVISPADRTVAEGETVSFGITGDDPDGEGLTWSATGLPEGLASSPAGVISGTPGYGSAGRYAVIVTAADGGSPALSDSASFTITVTDVNRPPLIVDLPDRVDDEREVVTVRPEATDPDGDDLAWSAAGLPPGMAISPATGVISGTPTTAGEYPVTVTVSDGGGLTDGTTFMWTIRDVNRRPVVDPLGDRTDPRDSTVTVAVSGSDPDGDPITWSVSGLPPGIAFDAATSSIAGTVTEAGVYTVNVTATDPGGMAGIATFTWTVIGPTGTPILVSVPPQQTVVGTPVSVQVSASHPDGLPLGFSASGLPPGVSIDVATGLITGVPDTVGLYDVSVRVVDSEARSASTSFLWGVIAAPDLPPEATDDDLVVVDGMNASRIEIAVLGNDRDPEGLPLTITGAGPVRLGEVVIDGDQLVLIPPTSWFGTISFEYTIADPAGNTASARVTVTIEPPLGDLVIDEPLVPTLTPPEPSDVVLGSMVQSLYVLRVPLTLLGGAVLSSLLFGGVLNLGFVVRRGIPRFVARRSRRLMAIILAAQGERVDAVRAPGSDEVVHRFLATDVGIRATGGEQRLSGKTWLEVETGEGTAWVDARNLTEHVDRSTFADDPRIPELLEQFVRSVRVRDPIDGLTSHRGLWIAYHEAPFHIPPARVAAMFDDPTERVWRGRNPAYPDTVGTIDARVGSSVLEAWDHPAMELVANRAAVPSTVVPVEFTNCNSVSIGADLQGRERLDQTAWLVFFEYEDGDPKIIALCKEG